MNGNDFLKKLKGMGISQSQVAEILGVTRQTVSCMRYAQSVKTSVVEKIANAIGSSVGELLNERPDLDLQELRRLRKENEELKEEIKKKDATIDKLIGIIGRDK